MLRKALYWNKKHRYALQAVRNGNINIFVQSNLLALKFI